MPSIGLCVGRCPTRRSRRFPLLVAAVMACLPLHHAAATNLTWDASGASPTTPVNGSGTWDKSTVHWSSHTADQVWVDGNSAIIGRSGGTAPYTITLGTNISASSVQFNFAGAGASYDIDGASTYNLSSSASTGFVVNAAAVSLTNGTFINGPAATPASTTVQSGGVLTLGTGSTLETAGIAGDFSDATVYFDGTTLKPLAGTSTANLTNGTGFISGTTGAYISTGGLTVDTSLVPTSGTNSAVYITDEIDSDPSLGQGINDGGLTKVGAGTLVLGTDDNTTNPQDPQFTYTGPTIVNGGTLALDTVEAGFFNSTGPFTSTNFTVNANGTLSVWATDAIAGEDGSNTVTINGGTLTTANPNNNIGSAYLADVTLNGGTITSAAFGSFAFMPTAILTVTANASISAASVAFETGSTINVAPDVTLTISSPLIDGASAGQVTTTGTGTVILQGANSYTGDTNVSSGTLTLAVGGSFSGTENITVAAGATFNLLGSTTSQPNLSVTGTATLGANPATGILTRKLNTLSLGATGATVTLAPAANHANRQLVVLGTSGSTTPLVFAGSTAAWQGTLDLTNNDLDIENGNLATITNQIQQGFNGGNWQGPAGILSSAAASDTSHLTALGVILNGNTYGSGTTLGKFDGINPASTDVLVKYTYYGDANLDGQVDGSDYTLIDAGFNSHGTLTGWQNGDFNYDGVIDGSDYTLIDNAFNNQGGNLSSTAEIASVNAQIAGTAAVPEPASIGSLTLGALALRFRRCRPRHPQPPTPRRVSQRK